MTPDASENIEQQRLRRIAECRAEMPRKYRALYDRAVSGKSLRAAINAECLACVNWQSREVTLCSDLACPLYAVRPYRNSGTGLEGHLSSVESIKSGGG